MKETRRITRFFDFCYILMLLMLLNILGIQAKPGDIRNEGSNIGKVFKAGAATANITPFLGGGIVGNYGNPPPAAHVHDELHARCLVLDDGTTMLAFIIVDNIGLNRVLIDEVKRLIQEESNIPRENLLVSATHTHSSVSAGGMGEKRRQTGNVEPFDEYQKFLIRRIADGVRIAINNLEPALIGWGVGSVPEHVFIRRWRMKPGTPIPNPFGGQDSVKMNPGRDPNLLEPAGKPDTDVSFISVQSIHGKPIALLANYSLHYVGGNPRDHLSTDYFGVFADRIQELLKADRQEAPFVGIMSNGTSGDVNNINFGAPSIKKAPYEQIKLVAEDVAREVFRVYNSVEYHNWVALGAAEEELTLQVRKPSAQMLARAKMVIARPDTVKPIHRHEVTYAHRIIQLEETWPDKIDIVLQALRIGDLGVAAIPFEVFAEIGLEIKTKSPFQPSFTIEQANGSYGYLPSPEQHELGGYETWLSTNKVEIEASRRIIAKLIDLFAKIE
jgi:neutral ceramidase